MNGKQIDKKYIFKKKAVNDYLLQDIATIVLKRVQYIYDSNKVLFDSVTQVLIELQPKVNQKMKFTSLLFQLKYLYLNW